MAAPAAFVLRLRAPQGLKAATKKWREAQQEFETAFSAHDAAELRTVQRRGSPQPPCNNQTEIITKEKS